MFKNYLTVALRNLMRKKLYTFINIFGLSLGLACCILMTLFVKHEWTHDWFHENQDQLYRLVPQRIQDDGQLIPIEMWDIVQPLWVVDALKNEAPGIIASSAFMYNHYTNITKDEKTFRHKTGLVSPDFLTMFTFPLLAGDPQTALNQPDGMVISKKIAHEFFGQIEDYNTLIGQPFTLRNKPFVVTGIMEDVPRTSSFEFDLLISAEPNIKFGITQKRGYTVAEIYLQIKQQNASQIIEALNSWAGKERLINDLFQGNPINITLQPLTDVYWNTDIPNRFTSQGNPTSVCILWTLAGLVLLIACSNFIALSVAESSGRAMEVGLRKVMGAKRSQVIQQFWSEALLLSLFGLFLGLALAEIFLPVFNGFVQRQLNISYSNDGLLLLILFGIVGLIAGSYPAIVLSRFQPVSALKGEANIGGRSRFTRTLIILQYTISVALIIGVGVMIQQQNYMHNKNLGFNKEHLVLIRTNRQVAQIYKQEILKNPNVMSATISDRTLTVDGGYSWNPYHLPDGTDVKLRLIGVDEDYLSTLEIPLIAGRNFSKDHPVDQKKAIVINEALAEKLGFKNPIGKTLTGFQWEGGALKDPIIIGMVRNFHMESLHTEIEPLALQMSQYKNGPFLLVRLHSNQTIETIEMFKNTWENLKTNRAFSLSFLDESIDRQYRNEMHWYRVIRNAALIAVILSCLGLFGLASLSVSRRTKEVGIRKVLGASMRDVMWLLSQDFVKLLLIANIIAWPIAYWAMNKWLANFAYHIELGLSVFILAGLLTLVIALLTVNAQTLKAARSNPIDALRYE